MTIPVYEYKCVNCGKVNEILEGVGTGELEKKCKYCGSERLDKIFSVGYVSSGRGVIGSHDGKTRCGGDERCEKLTCSDDGVCKR